MKIVKLGNKKSKVNRKMLTSFGRSVYHDEGVQSIAIRVNFKDGTSVIFKRDERDDYLEQWEKDEEDEE